MLNGGSMIWGFCVYFVYMIPLETDVLRKHRFQKYKWMASLWNISYCRKTVTFYNEGTFTLASSEQDLPAIFK